MSSTDISGYQERRRGLS